MRMLLTMQTNLQDEELQVDENLTIQNTQLHTENYLSEQN